MCRLFLCLAVAFSAGGLAAADEKATAIVKKGIDAHGGADALNKYKAGRFAMKGEVTVGGMDLEFTGNLVYAMPDKYRMDVTADVMGMKMVMQHVVKGDQIKASIKVGDMVIPAGGDQEKDELKFVAAMQEAEQFTPLLDEKKFTIQAADDEDVNGRKAAVIIVRPKSIDKDAKMYFDKQTGLLVKTSRKGLGQEGGAPAEVLEEAYMSEYKKVNGVQVPTKLLIHHDGKKHLTIALSDYELLEKVDDKEFTIDD